jgi:DNA invertase Pin-like site-specific DNA recombinase
MTRTNASPTRVLVAARLSRVTDQGHSRIERDDQAAEKWAAGRDDCRIVAVSKDAGVSGAVSPWKRPQLGPWLTDPALLCQYDEIVASSIDRLGRSARDLHDLRAWAEDHGKVLRILSPALTWPVPPDDLSGGIVWDVLGRVAEIERRATAKRYADMQQHLRDQGSLIGKPPWGFNVVGERYAKTIAADPRLIPYLRAMVERALRGDSLRSIAVWLDAEGVKPLHGKPWNSNTVANLLRNPALIGKRVDAKGRTLLQFDGVISPREFRQLQAALDSRPARRGPRINDAALLTGVIECDRCGRPMYRQRITKARKSGAKVTNVYYRCGGTEQSPSRCKNMVPLADIEEWLDQELAGPSVPEGTLMERHPWASVEIIERAVVPGDDHAAEIAEIEAEIRDLDLDAADYDDLLRALRAERTRLKALPIEPAQVIERSTGRTVADVWKTLNAEKKRQYLTAADIKVRVMSNGALRSTPGGETRFLEGDPHKIIGTLQGIVA